MTNMRLTILTLFAFLLCVGLLPAQTRKIAHRSHAGKPATFAFNVEDDNLGAIDPTRLLKPKETKDKTIKPHPSGVSNTPEVHPPLQVPVAGQPNGSGSPEPANMAPAESGKAKGKESGKAKRRKQKAQESSPSSSVAPVSQPVAQCEIQAQPRPANPANPSSNHGWMLLLGLMVFPVGPGIFFLSAVMQAHGKREG